MYTSRLFVKNDRLVESMKNKKESFMKLSEKIFFVFVITLVIVALEYFVTRNLSNAVYVTNLINSALIFLGCGLILVKLFDWNKED